MTAEQAEAFLENLPLDGRIRAVGEDVYSKKNKFSKLDVFVLADLLGVPGSDQPGDGWSRSVTDRKSLFHPLGSLPTDRKSLFHPLGSLPAEGPGSTDTDRNFLFHPLGSLPAEGPGSVGVRGEVGGV